MSTVPPVSPSSALKIAELLPPMTAAPDAGPLDGNFASLLSQGISGLEAKVSRAEGAIKAFALDDSIPAHQVTFALEEARLAVELAVEVRTRLLEGYREIMNMQL